MHSAISNMMELAEKERVKHKNQQRILIRLSTFFDPNIVQRHRDVEPPIRRQTFTGELEKSMSVRRLVLHSIVND